MLKRNGFTLVELLVVLTLLGLLAIVSITSLNPLLQLEKTANAHRLHDLEQIKNALDIYYNDHNCYPASLPFGSKWSQGGTVYMVKVPQDPDYPTYTYIYETDSTACPQWNVLYAQTSGQNSAGGDALCPLTKMPNCLPAGFKDSYACALSGNVSCNYLSSHYTNGNPAPIPTPTPTSAPTPTSTPTPVPSPTPVCQYNFGCTGSPTHCNYVPCAGTYTTQNCNYVCSPPPTSTPTP